MIRVQGQGLIQVFDRPVRERIPRGDDRPLIVLLGCVFIFTGFLLPGRGAEGQTQAEDRREQGFCRLHAGYFN